MLTILNKPVRVGIKLKVLEKSAILRDGYSLHKGNGIKRRDGSG